MAKTPQKPLTAEGVATFLGVNLRREALSLTDEQVVRAMNMDFHSMPGVLQARLGNRWLMDVGGGGGRVRRLTRYAARRYHVKSGNLYRDGTLIFSNLSENWVTTFLHYRPLNDTTTWTFIADDSGMRKDDGEDLLTWGIAAPETAPTVKGYSGGRLEAGDFTVVYTYVRKVGDLIAHESNPSPASDTVSLVGDFGAIAVESWEESIDPQVTHIRFYRTAVDGVLHLLDVTIAHETSVIAYGVTQTWEDDEDSTIEGLGTVFTRASSREGTRVCYNWEVDHDAGKEAHLLRSEGGMVSSTPGLTSGMVLLREPDTALGGTVEEDNDPPPVCSWVSMFQEHAFLCRDAANPNWLWYSKRYRPEAFPTENYLDIGPSEDPLQCSVPLVGFLGVFSLLTKYRVLGNDASGFVAIEALSSRGTPAPSAVSITEQGALYVARDGLFLTDFLAKDELLTAAIEPLFFGETVNGYAPIDWAFANEMCTATYKGRLWWGYRDTSGERHLAVFSRATGQWYFYSFNPVSLFVEEADDALILGNATSEVRTIEIPGIQDDDGDDISCEVWLPERAYGDPFRRKLFLYVQVDAECHTGEITGELWLDGALAHTFQVTGSRTRRLTRLPDGLLGRVWQLRFSYAGQERIAIYRADVLALPLQRA